MLESGCRDSVGFARGGDLDPGLQRGLNLGLDLHPAEHIGHRRFDLKGLRQFCCLRTRRRDLRGMDVRGLGQFAYVVTHPRVHQRKPEPRGDGPQRVIAVEDELRTAFNDHLTVAWRVDRLRPDAATHSIPRLQNGDIETMRDQRARSSETGKTGAENGNLVVSGGGAGLSSHSSILADIYPTLLGLTLAVR